MSVEELTRPIIGIENRTAQEVFDIMSDRIRLSATSPAGDLLEAKSLEMALEEYVPDYMQRRHILAKVSALLRAFEALRHQSTGVTEITDEMVERAWIAFDQQSGYSKPERFRAALTAALTAQERG